MKAVRKHTQEKWVLLYVERWLQTPVSHRDGRVEERMKGTPQGGVISPLLANLFLHYVFDRWMARHNPRTPFERYADDAVCHCRSGAEADALMSALKSRFAECGLELHPEKTKVVHCRDGKRKEEAEHVSFDFLGYTFRTRLSATRYGELFVNFAPAVSAKALKAMRHKIRRWGLFRWSNLSIEEIAARLNPVVRGWINDYGRFRKTGLHPVLEYIDHQLIRWAMGKYKQLKGRRTRAFLWMGRLAKRFSGLFEHWKFGVRPAVG